jgi:DNA-damage-inducible protein D
MNTEIQNIAEEMFPTFEDFKHENGKIYWWATEFSQMLGYNDLKSFKSVIDRATKAMISLNIDQFNNIEHIKRNVGKEEIDDYKLTRFACYLLAMNANPKKQRVAEAQAYFAQQTRNFELYLEEQSIDRIIKREDLVDKNKQLNAVVYNAGCSDFAKFTNEGYMGMYNMYNWQLAKRRNIPKDKLMDYMGSVEYAANIFRAATTAERIKNYNVHGQVELENTHRKVGGIVRKMVKETVGKFPEELPKERPLPTVKKDIKTISKEIAKIDKPDNKRK